MPSSCSAASRSRRSASCPYLLTLAGYGFYWFRLTAPEEAHRRTDPLTDRPPHDPGTTLDAASPVPRARPLVRRQGPRVRRSPTYAGSAGSPARTDGPSSIDLVEVTYDDGGRHRALPGAAGALPASPSTGSTTRSSAGGRTRSIGWAHAYDAVHDREAMAPVLRAFVAAEPDDRRRWLRSTGSPGHELDLEAHSTLFTGEQSNSSVAFGEDALMKVFRKVTPGVEPRHRDPRGAHPRRLGPRRRRSTAGSTGSTARRDADRGDALQLAMLQQFLRTASDGWDLALTSVRNLFAEADLHADEVGGDFAAEAARLGEALARGARRCWPSTSRPSARPPDAIAELADGDDDPARRRARRRTRAGASTPTALRDGCTTAVGALDGLRRAADPRRPAPRPDPAHRPRLEDRRLRGRAGQAARRAGAARLPVARRRRDAALLRLRAARGRATCGQRRRRRQPSSVRSAPRSGRQRNRDALPRGLRRRRPDPTTSRRCSTPTSPTRRSTRPSTRRATARPGWRSRWRPLSQDREDRTSTGEHR